MIVGVSQERNLRYGVSSYCNWKNLKSLLFPAKQPFRAVCMGSLQVKSMASGSRVTSLVSNAFC